MNVPRRERGQALILLAAWLFFGGGGSSALVAYDRPAKEVKKAVDHVITGETRRDAMVKDIDNWESGQDKLEDAVNKNREQLLQIMRRKDAQRSQTEPLIARMDETFREMDRNFLDIRFRLKEQVTKTEWKEIVAYGRD